MIKKEKNRKNKKKKGLTIVGSLLIILGISIVSTNYLYNYFLDKKEDNKIEEFYEEQEKVDLDTIEDTTKIEVQEEKKKGKVNYIAVIKIPKIGLEKGLCPKGSYCNNVNQNIQILNEADYPDKDTGNFILAGHSGNGRSAYFKNIYKLEREDLINIIYRGFEYKYKITNIYDIEKTGSASIVRNKDKNILTLVTCRQNTDKQIIVISELVERNEYHG